MFDLNLLTGTITFDDLSPLTGQPLAGQVDSLKEDLLQVGYGERLLLDVGWYPEFDEGGCFQIRAIQDEDWECPLFLARALSWQELAIQVAHAQQVLEALHLKH